MTEPTETIKPSQYEIVRPTPEDMPRLLELWREQYDYHHTLDPDYYVPYSEENAQTHLQEIMQGDEPHILAAREGTALVGFITFGMAENNYLDTNITRYGELKELLVTEDARGKGIAKALVASVENRFQAQGLGRVGVQCSVSNKPAIALYEQLGYKPSQVTLYKSLPKT